MALNSRLLDMQDTKVLTGLRTQRLAVHNSKLAIGVKTVRSLTDTDKDSYTETSE
jgi:hypothetical protein